MNVDGSTDPLASRLRLFLSVDVVGSTAFKQSNQAAFNADINIADDVKAEPWFSPIAQFYREVERLFAKEWSQYSSFVAPSYEWPSVEAPQLWKSAGDELLYTKVLTDHREALACLSCWIKAIQEYRKILKDRFPNLDLKSGAWLAGFPITNTEVIFRSSVGNMPPDYDDDDPVYSNLSLLHDFYVVKESAGLTRDFIGPSIDTGFRLCELATPRKLIISVDLALMLVHAIRGAPPGLPFVGFNMHYDGRVRLKGVFGDADYPVFWVDMATNPKLEHIEDKLLHISPENTDNIKEFCELFIEANSNRIIIPYIMKNADSYFARPPEHHERRIRSLRSFWQNERERRIDEAKAFSESAGGKSIDEQSVEKLLNSIEGRSADDVG